MLGVGNLPKLLLMWLYWGAAIVLTALTPTTLYMLLPVWLSGHCRAELRKPWVPITPSTGSRSSSAAKKRSRARTRTKIR